MTEYRMLRKKFRTEQNDNNRRLQKESVIKSLYIDIFPVKTNIYNQQMYFVWKTREGKVKVKVSLVQSLRLCTGHTAHRGSRGIALLFHDQRH